MELMEARFLSNFTRGFQMLLMACVALLWSIKFYVFWRSHKGDRTALAGGHWSDAKWWPNADVLLKGGGWRMADGWQATTSSKASMCPFKFKCISGIGFWEFEQVEGRSPGTSRKSMLWTHRKSIKRGSMGG